MQPTIYLYNLKSEKGQQIELLCVKLHVACRHVNAADYGKAIGYIAEIEGFTAEEKMSQFTPFEDEMLLFKGFDQEMLTTFLAEYRQAGIATIPLKAGLTPTNVQWSSIELQAELSEEHRAFNQQQ